MTDRYRKTLEMGPTPDPAMSTLPTIQHDDAWNIEQQRQAYITAYYTDRANSGLAALTARRP